MVPETHLMSTSAGSTAQRTVLHAVQAAAGAKMIDFHGWEMPVQFAGIVAEHRAVRDAAGLFDLGHMGRLHLSGSGALAFLEARVSRPLASTEPGQVRYGLICADDGTVEDDCLVTREGEAAFHVVVNASNLAKVLDLWQAPGLLPDALRLRNLSAEQAMLAVQGPQATAILARIGLDPGELGQYRCRDLAWRGATVRLSRTGYTGEDGCECFLPADRAEELWRAAHEAGAVPCGLGARDSLRLEAGMPLYGHELDRAHTAAEAGLDWAIGKKKRFTGSEVLHRQLERGTARRLVGLRLLGKRLARQGYAVMSAGTVVGEVTSGTLSPTLGHPIAMAYVATPLAAPGTKLEVDIRGQSREAAEVVGLPFYKRGK